MLLRVGFTGAERRAESTSFAGNGTLSSVSTVFIAVFLSVLGIAALGIIACKIRRWRATEQPGKLSSRKSALETKAEGCDLEAQSIDIPNVAPPGVRWTPQIRSISCPMSIDPDKKSTNLTVKRARSPPPTYVSKPPHQLASPYPTTAPPHILSFAAEDIVTPVAGSKPVRPQTLSVSGMQTRSLERAGQLAKNLASAGVD